MTIAYEDKMISFQCLYNYISLLSMPHFENDFLYGTVYNIFYIIYTTYLIFYMLFLSLQKPILQHEIIVQPRNPLKIFQKCQRSSEEWLVFHFHSAKLMENRIRSWTFCNSKPFSFHTKWQLFKRLLIVLKMSRIMFNQAHSL